jgi:hypothetical protein
MLMFNGPATLAVADGIPLDTYPAAAAQTVVTLAALYAFTRLSIAALCVIVLLRYRSAIPLMFGVILVNYLASRVILWSMPIARAAMPPAPGMTVALMALSAAGFALSLREPRERARAAKTR